MFLTTEDVDQIRYDLNGCPDADLKNALETIDVLRNGLNKHHEDKTFCRVCNVHVSGEKVANGREVEAFSARRKV